MRTPFLRRANADCLRVSTEPADRLPAARSYRDRARFLASLNDSLSQDLAADATLTLEAANRQHWRMRKMTKNKLRLSIAGAVGGVALGAAAIGGIAFAQTSPGSTPSTSA